MPAAAKAAPTSIAAGKARMPRGEVIRPRPSTPSRLTTPRKPTTYRLPRSSAHMISPRATSPMAMGVEMMAS